MTRKLLPYEYDLIDALGITKEEYFDFVAQQHIYQDPKQGTALDVRAESCFNYSRNCRHPFPGGIRPVDA
jgi:hypothetical protein